MKTLERYVTVVCTSASGEPTLYMATVQVTEEQYQDGDHYDLAKEIAAENGYEAPMIAFDTRDEAAKQLAQVSEFMKQAETSFSA